jgi:hypothetical protein
VRSLADAGKAQGNGFPACRTEQGAHFAPAPCPEPSSRYEHKGHRGNSLQKTSILVRIIAGSGAASEATFK